VAANERSATGKRTACLIDGYRHRSSLAALVGMRGDSSWSHATQSPQGYHWNRGEKFPRFVIVNNRRPVLDGQRLEPELALYVIPSWCSGDLVELRERGRRGGEERQHCERWRTDRQRKYHRRKKGAQKVAYLSEALVKMMKVRSRPHPHRRLPLRHRCLLSSHRTLHISQKTRIAPTLSILPCQLLDLLHQPFHH
jgi:hypothetical protein